MDLNFPVFATGYVFPVLVTMKGLYFWVLGPHELFLVFVWTQDPEIEAIYRY